MHQKQRKRISKLGTISKSSDVCIRPQTNISSRTNQQGRKEIMTNHKRNQKIQQLVWINKKLFYHKEYLERYIKILKSENRELRNNLHEYKSKEIDDLPF